MASVWTRLDTGNQSQHRDTLMMLQLAGSQAKKKKKAHHI